MPPTRRDFLKTTGAAGLATALAGAASRSMAQTATDSQPRTVQTDVLDIAYEAHGNPAGTAVILLHGFPYDVRSFDGVVAPLAAAGHRVLVPWLRGYGPTRFRNPSAPRMAEQAALAQDVIDFADALELPRFALAGFDWGNRAACIVSILEPERVIGQVSIGGYSVQNTVARGGVDGRSSGCSVLVHVVLQHGARRCGAAKRIATTSSVICGNTWSPQWHYTDEAYARSAPSFDNPDFVEVRRALVSAPSRECSRRAAVHRDGATTRRAAADRRAGDRARARSDGPRRPAFGESRRRSAAVHEPRCAPHRRRCRARSAGASPRRSGGGSARAHRLSREPGARHPRRSAGEAGNDRALYDR